MQTTHQHSSHMNYRTGLALQRATRSKCILYIDIDIVLTSMDSSSANRRKSFALKSCMSASHSKLGKPWPLVPVPLGWCDTQRGTTTLRLPPQQESYCPQLQAPNLQSYSRECHPMDKHGLTPRPPKEFFRLKLLTPLTSASGSLHVWSRCICQTLMNFAGWLALESPQKNSATYLLPRNKLDASQNAILLYTIVKPFGAEQQSFVWYSNGERRNSKSWWITKPGDVSLSPSTWFPRCFSFTNGTL